MVDSQVVLVTIHLNLLHHLMTGLVQPQQPHWPQHPTAIPNQHLQNYLLDGDEDLDDLDYDDYGGSGSPTPGGPSSPPSSRSKRGSSTKRISQSGTKKSTGKKRKFHSLRLFFF